MAVGGMRAKGIILSTDLLKWYLDHGLAVTNITMVIEFMSGYPFKKFQEMVTAGRRKGDLDDALKVIAEQLKLTGVIYDPLSL